MTSAGSASPQSAPVAEVASRVAELRRDKGWNAQEFVDRCMAGGLDRMTTSVLANLETGRRGYVTVDELLTFAAVLDVPPVALWLPLDVDTFAVTPAMTVPPWRVLRWVRGLQPLTQADVAFWRTETEAMIELDEQHRGVERDVQAAEQAIRRAEFQGSADAQAAAKEQYARALEELSRAWRMTERHRFIPPRLPGAWIDDMVKLDIDHNPAWRQAEDA